MAAVHATSNEAVRAAQRGVALAATLPASHSALGWALQFQLKFTEANEALKRAYRFGRGDARTLRIYATFLWQIGKVGEATRIADESAALDPLHPRHQQMIAQIHMAAGRYGDAAATARRTLQLAPTRIEARRILALGLTQLGRTREAQTEIRQLPQGSLRRLTAEALLNSRIGNRTASDSAMSEIKARHSDLANYELAQIHAQRGEKDQALAMLEAALRQRDPDLARIAGDRLLDPIRSDQRFRDIMSRLQLPV